MMFFSSCLSNLLLMLIHERFVVNADFSGMCIYIYFIQEHSYIKNYTICFIHAVSAQLIFKI